MDPSPLEPYFGLSFDGEKFGPPRLGTAHELRAYPPDRSGRKTYRINTLGYRGQEYAPAAARRIYVCGCSVSFGTGLDEQEIWPHFLAERYAAAAGLAPEAINLLNFSEDGGSNDYISRKMIAQCDRLAPDLAACLFTFSGRVELVDPELGEHPQRIGPWLLSARTDAQILEREQRIIDQAEHYFRFASTQQLHVNALRNILLFQFFCQARGIPFVIAWLEAAPFLGAPLGPVESALWALVDKQRFCAVRQRLDDATDVAADGMHAGPRYHAEVADRMWARLLRAGAAP